jgi:hypothetical protein
MFLHPTQGGGFGNVYGVAPVVAQPIINPGDHGFIAPGEFKQGVGEFKVGELVAGPNIVDLANFTFPEHEVHPKAIVGYVAPISYVKAVSINRDLEAIKQVAGKKRDEFFRELVRAIVVGRPGDHYWQAMSGVVA